MTAQEYIDYCTVLNDVFKKWHAPFINDEKIMM